MLRIQFSNIDKQQQEYLLSEEFRKSFRTANYLIEIDKPEYSEKFGEILVDAIVQGISSKGILDIYNFLEEVISKNKNTIANYCIKFTGLKMQTSNALIESPVINIRNGSLDSDCAQTIKECFYQNFDVFDLSQRLHFCLAGINSYKDRNIPNLKSPHNDISIIHELFSSYAKPLGRKIPDARADEILETIEFNNKNARADDSFVFHFSGHASPSEDGSDLLLWTSDTIKSDLSETTVSFKTIFDRIMSRAVDRSFRSFLFILDCCYSGNIVKIYNFKKTEHSNIYLCKEYPGVYFILSTPPDSRGKEITGTGKSDTTIKLEKTIGLWRTKSLTVYNQRVGEKLLFSTLCAALSEISRGSRSVSTAVALPENVDQIDFNIKQDVNFFFEDMEQNFESAQLSIREMFSNGKILSYVEKSHRIDCENLFNQFVDLASYKKSQGIARKKFNLLFCLANNEITISEFVNVWYQDISTESYNSVYRTEQPRHHVKAKEQGDIVETSSKSELPNVNKILAHSRSESDRVNLEPEASAVDATLRPDRPPERQSLKGIALSVFVKSFIAIFFAAVIWYLFLSSKPTEKKLTDKIVSLEGQIKTLDSDLNAAKNKMDALDGELTAKKQELSNAKRELDKLSFGPGSLPENEEMQFGHRIQKVLWEAGCYSGYIDGDIGADTIKAIENLRNSQQNLKNQIIQSLQNASKLLTTSDASRLTSIYKSQYQSLQNLVDKGARCDIREPNLIINETDLNENGFVRIRGRYFPNSDLINLEIPNSTRGVRRLVLVDTIGTVQDLAIYIGADFTRPPIIVTTLVGKSARGRAEFETTSNDKMVLRIKRRDSSVIWFSLLLIQK